MSKKIIVGLTGGFGTGKTTVAEMFEGLGAVVLNADKIAHGLISPGGCLYKKAVSLFGKKILKKNGAIDKRRLGEIVFNDKKKLMLINKLIHPKVIKIIKDRIKEKGAIYIIDAPLLLEAGLVDMIDKLIVVAADKKTQIERCTKKFGLKKEDILKRIRGQMSLSKKKRLADFIIDNNGSIRSTQKSVIKIWREIKNGTRIKT